jgi:hypothetical protein
MPPPALIDARAASRPAFESGNVTNCPVSGSSVPTRIGDDDALPPFDEADADADAELAEELDEVEEPHPASSAATATSAASADLELRRL